MQKEEKVVVVLLLMALGSLAAASWGLGDFDPAPEKVAIVAEGTAASVQRTEGGHLIIRLYSSQMPIFVSRDSGADLLAGRIAKGDRIRAKGEIAWYEGRREIAVQGAADVEVL
jgi:hypothetical protein